MFKLLYFIFKFVKIILINLICTDFKWSSYLVVLFFESLEFLDERFEHDKCYSSETDDECNVDPDASHIAQFVSEVLHQTIT